MIAALAVARNDLLRWCRSPLAVATALVPPLVMAGLIAVLSRSATQQPVALVNQSSGPLAARMAHVIESDAEAYSLHVVDAATAAHQLAAQQVAAVVFIPSDFDARVAEDGAVVGLTVNNVDVDFSDDVRRSLDRSVAEFDAPQLGYLGELNGPSQGLLLPNVYRVAVAERNLRETTVDFLHYNLVPVLVLVVLNVGMLGTALLVAQDFERGTGRTLLLAPVSRRAVVAGRALGGTAATAAAVLPVALVGALTGVFSPVASHWPAVAAIMALTAVVAVGLGLVLAVLLRRARAVAMAAVTVATYMFLLGGGFTTLVFLPEWIQTLSRAVPTGYAIAGLRQALFYPDLRGVGADLLGLALSGAVALALGTVLVRRAWRTAR